MDLKKLKKLKALLKEFHEAALNDDFVVPMNPGHRRVISDAKTLVRDLVEETECQEEAHADDEDPMGPVIDGEPSRWP